MPPRPDKQKKEECTVPCIRICIFYSHIYSHIFAYIFTYHIFAYVCVCVCIFIYIFAYLFLFSSFHRSSLGRLAIDVTLPSSDEDIIVYWPGKDPLCLTIPEGRWLMANAT